MGRRKILDLLKNHLFRNIVKVIVADPNVMFNLSGEVPQASGPPR